MKTIDGLMKALWSIECPCGATISASAERLLGGAVVCQNCGKEAPENYIKTAAEGYLSMCQGLIALQDVNMPKPGWSVRIPA